MSYEPFRRALVVVLCGPPMWIAGLLWFAVAAPLALVFYAIATPRETWLGRYCWFFATFPLQAFWSLLTGREAALFREGSS